MRLFFWLGIEHIFLGFDHILFLLALVIVSRFGDLVKIVTSFTVAHTITLMLATLEVLRVDREWVEIAIAATIVYTAVENFWIRPGDPAGRRRWMLTFVFGLIHGFGFAGVLGELGLPTEGLVRSLVAFNVGVEAGQLLIVAAIFPLFAGLRRLRCGRVVQLTTSALVGLCGLGWLLDRAMGWELMPF
ncbi:MAG: HupE/UreJ family protein [Pirellulales bacterium]